LFTIDTIDTIENDYLRLITIKYDWKRLLTIDD